jgi:hypothetical protein
VARPAVLLRGATVGIASVAALLATAPVSPASARPVPGISTAIKLPAKTMVTGSTMHGVVIVTNRTGHAVEVEGCESWLQVGLSNRDTKAQILWHDCLEQLTIPEGRSRYPFTLSAMYRGCVVEPPMPDGVPLCEAGTPPPLPPGRYRARIHQRNIVVRDPPSVVVRVTAPST